MFQNGYDLLKADVLLKIFTALLAIFCILKFLGLRKKGKNLPPGPFGIPVFGYLPFLTKTPHLKFEELRKKYGNVFSIYLGSQLTVILGDVDGLRDTFGRDEYHGRPAESVICPGAFKKNISNVNGKDWMEQRRLMFYILKGFGKENDYVENIVQDEVKRFLKYVEETKGKPLDIKPITSTCVSNVISTITWGKSYECGDKISVFFDDLVQEMVEHADMTSCQQYLPWMKWPIFNKYRGWDKYVKKTAFLREYFKKEVKEHKSALDPNEPKDFIDAFLIQERKAKETGQNTSCDDEMLLGTLFTMVVAGGETVRTSLHWAFLTLVEHPEIQKKIQKEIDDVIGHERQPEWSDQRNMPYTICVLMEVQRLYTIVPLNVFRLVMEDTKLGDYDIPKGTMVLSNLWKVLHDPKHWKESDKFIPERFLDETKKAIVKPKSYLPFSYGKRLCPGESLAMMEMFLFLTATLQKYNASLPPNTKIDLTPDIFATAQPKFQKICLTRR